MAKLADAADLKSADPKGLWGFKSPSRHHLTYCCVTPYRCVSLHGVSVWKLLRDPQRDVNVTYVQNSPLNSPFSPLGFHLRDCGRRSLSAGHAWRRAFVPTLGVVGPGLFPTCPWRGRRPDCPRSRSADHGSVILFNVNFAMASRSPVTMALNGILVCHSGC